MGYLYIKQKVFNIAGKFTVKNELDEERYFVEGSLMKIPKTFTVTDALGHEVSTITKKPFSFLPTFFVDVYGSQQITIKKQFTFFKAHYTLEGMGIEVHGNLWDMNFSISHEGKEIGNVKKKWVSFADHYELYIEDDELEALFVSIVIAIDYVRVSSNAAASGGAGGV